VELRPPQFCPVCRVKPCRCTSDSSPCIYDVPSRNQHVYYHRSSSRYSLKPPSSSSYILSFCGCHINPLTATTRWKQRRQSVRELREQEGAVKDEYDRLRRMEQDMRARQPPQYEAGMSSSGESVFGMDNGRPRVASVTSSQGSTQYSR
jgi:hypothetical protein